MRQEPLSKYELIDLLSAVSTTSKSIRSNMEQTTSLTMKVIQYENMLRIVENFQERPEMVRQNLRSAKEMLDQHTKIMEALSNHPHSASPRGA